MPKKFLIVSLCFPVLLFSVPAFSENEFSIRGGVKFGQTLDEIHEIELTNGQNVNWTGAMVYCFSFGDAVCFFPETFPDAISIVNETIGTWATGTVANIEDSEIQYIVDREDKLAELIYFFHAANGDHSGSQAEQIPYGYKTFEEARPVYDTLLCELTKKYGSPQKLPEFEYGFLKTPETWGFRIDKEYVTDSAEWLVPFDSYFVKIELYLEHTKYYWDRSSQNKENINVDEYKITLGYAYFSNEKVESEKQKYQEQLIKEAKNYNTDL